MNSIEDAHDKGLLTYGHEDFIIEALKHCPNHARLSLRLARTISYRPDYWDNLMLERQIQQGRN